MPIVDIQRRFRELGRIRLGKTEPTKGGKTRPVKIARFRLTSPWQHLIEQAAELYGGEPRPWKNPGTKGDEHEVFVEVDSLPVVIPPGEVFDQWYELWTGGGCARRCDGVAQVLVDRPCACPEDPIERQELAAKGEACKPTTRVRLMLPEVADVGIWRLESHSFHAAAELGGAAGLVEAATRQGAMIPADLRLGLREGARRPGQQRRKFYVPSISFRGALGPVLERLGVLEAGSDMPSILGQVEGRPSISGTAGAPALPAGGTPFDPAPVERSSFPGPQPDPTPPAAPPAPDPEPGPPPPEPGGFEPERAADPGSTAPEPSTFEPPAFDPEAQREAEEGGRSYSGPQLIAIKLGEAGVKDRGEKLRVVARLVGREVSSSKDLDPREVRAVLAFLDRDEDEEVAAFWADHVAREIELDGAQAAQEPAPAPESPPPAPEAQPIRGELVERPPAARVSTPPERTPDDPAGWDTERWRAVLTEHGLKPIALLREANRLGRARNVAPPANLGEIAGSGLAGDLAGWVYAGGPS